MLLDKYGTLTNTSLIVITISLKAQVAKGEIAAGHKEKKTSVIVVKYWKKLHREVIELFSSQILKT